MTLIPSITILLVWYHWFSASNNEPQHQFCPTGDDSWFDANKDACKPKIGLSVSIIEFIKSFVYGIESCILWKKIKAAINNVNVYQKMFLLGKKFRKVADYQL